MKQYKITFGAGLGFNLNFEVSVEDFQGEQEAVDNLIDGLEERRMGVFLTEYEINSGEFPEGTYVVGGKNNKRLYHYGEFHILRL